MTDHITLTIDHTTVTVPNGSTVLQACERAHIEIPVFCYHPKLSIAGNCRMCLVEMEGSKKPIASCAMPASEGMVIRTQSEMVKHARQGVLELLLINHPLDCPICDQGGECDLQDITVSYGCGDNRYDLNKRAVIDKAMGPLIKTHMTRCIHCTRCVRFSHEVAGTSELGTLYRGEHMEITTLLDSAVTSELSGNLIDICPVGALTNKPYAFHGRPWELSKTYTIDVMDAVGCHIRMDTHNHCEVMRILPRVCDATHEHWISDKTRFAYDGLKYQRLQHPYDTSSGTWIPVSWSVALEKTATLITSVKPEEVAVIAGDLADVESMFALKTLMQSIGGVHFESRQNGSKLYPKSRSDYLFNTTMHGIDQADVILIVGSNPRLEAPTLNARIKKRTWHGDLHIGYIGASHDLTYDYEHLGTSPADLSVLSDSNHPFVQKLINAHHPMIIVGQGALTHEEGARVFHFLKQSALIYKVIRKDWHGFNVLAVDAATVGAFDLGFLPHNPKHTLEDLYTAVESGNIKVIYALNADDLDFKRLQHAHIIYQGHHGDAGAAAAHIILAGCAYSEKRATYVNLEGRIQMTTPACAPPHEAKEDWRIVRALSHVLHEKGICPTLPFDDEKSLWSHLTQHYPLFKTQGITRTDALSDSPDARLSTPTSHAPFVSMTENFYTTNVIARNSKNMAQCVHENVVRARTPMGRASA